MPISTNVKLGCAAGLLTFFFCCLIVPASCLRPGATSVFDPIDLDPTARIVNAPVKGTMMVDLQVVDPEGRPVPDVRYILDFTVPGRYGQDVGTNEVSPDGRIQYTQSGAVSCYVELIADGFYNWGPTRLTGGTKDEAALTITYKQTLTMTPVEQDLPDLIGKNRMRMETVFRDDPSSPTAGAIGADIRAIAISFENGKPVSIAIDTVTSPVLATANKAYILLDYEYAPNPTLVETNGFVQPDWYTRKVRLVSMGEDDGFVPALRWYKGYHPENRETWVDYYSDYNIATETWLPWIMSMGRRPALVRIHETGRFRIPSELGYQRVVSHASGHDGFSIVYGCYVKINGFYGILYFGGGGYEDPSLGLVAPPHPHERGTWAALYLNPKGDRDARMRLDREPFY